MSATQKAFSHVGQKMAGLAKQLAGLPNVPRFALKHMTGMSEDCLYLNVYTPVVRKHAAALAEGLVRNRRCGASRLAPPRGVSVSLSLPCRRRCRPTSRCRSSPSSTAAPTFSAARTRSSTARTTSWTRAAWCWSRSTTGWAPSVTGTRSGAGRTCWRTERGAWCTISCLCRVRQALPVWVPRWVRAARTAVTAAGRVGCRVY